MHRYCLIALLLAAGCSQRVAPIKEPLAPPPQPKQQVQYTEEHETTTGWADYTYRSKYDHYLLTYRVAPPSRKEEPTGVVICIGNLDHFGSLFDEESADWKIHIPSRPYMNYQLLAEGDLWGVLQEATGIDHTLRSLPVFLIGSEETAGIALSIANNYRFRFSGVAVTGTLPLDPVPNLDFLPVVLFGNKHPTHERMAKRLEMRGNEMTAQVNGDWADAVKKLHRLAKKRPHAAPYTFFDNRHAQVYPWLKVIARKSELEPVYIKVDWSEGTLNVHGENVKEIQINRSQEANFPRRILQVHLGGQIYALPPGRSVMSLGDPQMQEEWRRKVDTPSGLANFFSHEPVYVVFQDIGKNLDYLERVEELAHVISQLRLDGFPRMDVQLPLIPLSEYSPDRFEPHRAILIGEPSKTRVFLENEVGYLPLEIVGKQAKLHHKRVRLTSSDGVSYGMIYPPENNRHLKLALLLAAEDTEGIDTLQKHYSQATSLYDEGDLWVWSHRHGRPSMQIDHTFDSYWGPGNVATSTIPIPPQPHTAWQSHLEALLLTQSGAEKIFVPSLVAKGQGSINAISPSLIQKHFPERQFAVVTLRGSMGAEIANKLAQEPLFTPKEWRRKKQVVLVDLASLDQLSEQEREAIGIRELPLTLRELITKEIAKNPKEFVKALLRQANRR